MERTKPGTKQRRRWGVFPIVNGCSTECEFEGSSHDCVKFVRRQLKQHPSNDYIITPIQLY